MSAIITKWTPFDFACRLRTLQQGTLNVGNTTQNKANLLSLATAQANSPSNPPWARWGTAATTAKVHSNLFLEVRLVPGYKAPPGTGYQNQIAATPWVFTVTTAASAVAYAGVWNNTGHGVNGSLCNVGDFMRGWDSVGNNLGTESPAAPTLPDGVTPVVAAMRDDGTGGNLIIVVSGTVAQTAFTSAKITVSGTQYTFNTASPTDFYQVGGYTGWVWTADHNQLGIANTAYPVVLS